MFTLLNVSAGLVVQAEEKKVKLGGGEGKDMVPERPSL
jgi:hypothetical protein